MPKLLCMSGMNKGEVYELAEGDNLIGRGEDVHIRIFDKKASRHHGKLIVSKDGMVFKDLKSTNGSRINNQFVENATNISIGDYLHIGQTVFLVSGDTPPEANQEAAEGSLMDAETMAKLQTLSFTCSDTTNLRKMKKEKLGRSTGYLAFFDVA